MKTMKMLKAEEKASKYTKSGVFFVLPEVIEMTVQNNIQKYAKRQPCMKYL